MSSPPTPVETWNGEQERVDSERREASDLREKWQDNGWEVSQSATSNLEELEKGLDSSSRQARQFTGGKEWHSSPERNPHSDQELGGSSRRPSSPGSPRRIPEISSTLVMTCKERTKGEEKSPSCRFGEDG
ncbi:hypothetical protein CDL15_Pgr027706 [Punica granatum]|uniref:Uncharacterized protein n=1 Tax=Punica granatum TaxID=22663 RepID=A0A218XJQ0_PUNGR|nr:hypothetical protein CDL15_Pgr027706 [Punica granatum]